MTRPADADPIEPDVLPFPPWLRKKLPTGGAAVSRMLDQTGADTVCRGAQCPNRAECQAAGQAAFLLMGPDCTRRCTFCAMRHHTPPAPLDPAEPERVADAAARLSLKHGVITSTTRDDLPDGGASHFAATVAAFRKRLPGASVEILTSDFNGDRAAWAVAVDAGADVFNHNMETVPSLYAAVRPGADYRRSLSLLAFARERSGSETRTKSGLMVGLGESLEEIRKVALDLRAAGVSMITVGQYMCPRQGGLRPVSRYVTPEEFSDLAADLRGMGFDSVGCGSWVRSSYGAAEAFLSLGTEGVG